MTIASTASLASMLTGYGRTATQSAGASTGIGAEVMGKPGQGGGAADSGASRGDSVTLSPAALAAAAAKADNAKDFGTLSMEVRAALDAQYAEGKPKGGADLSGLSGRALAAIVLNQDGSFDPGEVQAAKRSLSAQTSANFSAAKAYGGGISAIASFSRQIAEQYDAMSPEERTARGWSAEFRDASEGFATQMSSASSLLGTPDQDSVQSQPSLFDLMGG